MTTARIDEIYNNKMALFQISNVVSTYVLTGRTREPLFIDLLAVARAFEGSVYYNSKQFPNLVIRTTRPVATVLLYQRGVALCMSAKSENESTMAVYYVLRKLRKIVYPDLCICVRSVINVVSYLRTEIPCNTKLILLQHPHCTDCPKKFSGTIIQLGILDNAWGRISATIFKDGAFVITGAKSTEEAQRVYMFFLDFIRPYFVFGGQDPSEAHDSNFLESDLNAHTGINASTNTSTNTCANANTNANVNVTFSDSTSKNPTAFSSSSSSSKKIVKISPKPTLQNSNPAETRPKPASTSAARTQTQTQTPETNKKSRAGPAMFTCQMCNNPCVGGEKKHCCLCMDDAIAEPCRFCKEFQEMTENITKSIPVGINNNNPWLDPLYA